MLMVRPYKERRQQSWDWTVQWARTHPRLSRLVALFCTFLTVGWILLALVDAAEGRWVGALYYGIAVPFGLWMRLGWMRIMRGEARPTTWRPTTWR